MISTRSVTIFLVLLDLLGRYLSATSPWPGVKTEPSGGLSCTRPDAMLAPGEMSIHV
jgi:hypothetical protein